jgi:hypothetical protein
MLFCHLLWLAYFVIQTLQTVLGSTRRRLLLLQFGPQIYEFTVSCVKDQYTYKDSQAYSKTDSRTTDRCTDSLTGRQTDKQKRL